MKVNERENRMIEFNDSFFKKEVRCGFEVPEMMKRAWAAQMEVLMVIDDICKKNNLLYFAYSGTLLGAIRHKGYIPWDDDIDLAMMRKDYMKLIHILPEQLPQGFVMTGIHAVDEKYRTDRTHQLMVSAYKKLWDTNEYIKYFHGYPYEFVAIDIFPIDYIPDDNEMFYLQKALIQKALIIVAKWDEFKKQGVLDRYLKEYEEQIGMKLPQKDTKFELLKLTDQLAAMYGKKDGDRVTSIAWNQKKVLKDDKYLNVVERPFENIQIPVPIAYDEVLTVCYGDYKKFVKGGTTHNYPFYKEMDKMFRNQLRQAGIPYTVEEFCRKLIANEIIIDWKE